MTYEIMMSDKERENKVISICYESLPIIVDWETYLIRIDIHQRIELNSCGKRKRYQLQTQTFVRYHLCVSKIGRQSK